MCDMIPLLLLELRHSMCGMIPLLLLELHHSMCGMTPLLLVQTGCLRSWRYKAGSVHMVHFTFLDA